MDPRFSLNTSQQYNLGHIAIIGSAEKPSIIPIRLAIKYIDLMYIGTVFLACNATYDI